MLTSKFPCRLAWHRWSDGPPESRYCVRCGRAHPKIEQHLLRLVEEKKQEASRRLSAVTENRRIAGSPDSLLINLDALVRELHLRAHMHYPAECPRPETQILAEIAQVIEELKGRNY